MQLKLHGVPCIHSLLLEVSFGESKQVLFFIFLNNNNNHFQKSKKSPQSPNHQV